MTDVCAREGCESEIPPSRGPRARKWCSDACRKRAERENVRIESFTAAASAPAGEVTVAVSALLDTEEAREHAYPNALAELAVAQARMVDGGNTHASVALRNTLEALADELALRAESGLPTFDVWEVVHAITREGVNPDTDLGRAILATTGGLLHRYPPPTWPNGWRGTALDGEPEDFAGGDYANVRPLGFWPDPACRYCGPMAASQPTQVLE